MFPLLSSFEYDYVTGPGSPDLCAGMIVSSDSRFARIQHAIDPAPINQWMDFGITAPRCGVQQRLSYWNQSCKVVLPLVMHPDASTDGTPNLDNGSQYTKVPIPAGSGYAAQEFCLARGPRELVLDCPDGMTCESNGECVAGGQPPLLSFITNPAVPSPPVLATTPVRGSGSRAVVMVKASKHRHADDDRRICRRGERRLGRHALFDPLMRPCNVEIVEAILLQHVLEVPLAEDDEVIEALAPDAAENRSQTPCGGVDRWLLRMYRCTVRLATRIPSLSSSPRMRSAPQSRFSVAMC
jgi:hypothetical protein